MTTTPTLDLVAGWSLAVTSAGIGFHYPAEEAPDGATGIYWVKTPTSPDAALVLSPYPLSADPTRPENETGVQFWLRTPGGLGSLAAHWAKRDSLETFLLGNYPICLPSGMQVTAFTWTSGTQPALDDNQRWVSIANYTARHYRPSTNRS